MAPRGVQCRASMGKETLRSGACVPLLWADILSGNGTCFHRLTWSGTRCISALWFLVTQDHFPAFTEQRLVIGTCTVLSMQLQATVFSCPHRDHPTSDACLRSPTKVCFVTAIGFEGCNRPRLSLVSLVGPLDCPGGALYGT